jgi:hypothetical protein
VKLPKIQTMVSKASTRRVQRNRFPLCAKESGRAGRGGRENFTNETIETTAFKEPTLSGVVLVVKKYSEERHNTSSQLVEISKLVGGTVSQAKVDETRVPQLLNEVHGKVSGVLLPHS